MGDIVNLLRARKQKARKTAEITATANRAKFGRTKTQRLGDEKRRHLTIRAAEQAKLDKE